MVAASALLAACSAAGEQFDPPASTGEVLTGAGGGSASGVWTSSSGSSGSPDDPGEAGGGWPSGKLGPPYPIVLAHGFFGFEDFAGAGYVSYFYNLKEALAEGGETVFTPSVDPFNSSEVRGAQLLARIEQILAATGHEKVNIIAHSQGGLDARVVAHDRPDLVASIVTVATPHLGSKVADVALELVADERLQDILDDLINAIGAPLYDQIGNETSVFAALEQFSTPGIAEFNARFTDSPGVYYASFGGRTNRARGGRDCSTLNPAPFVAQFDDGLDPVHPLLSLTETLLDGGIGESFPNDGLVRARDARWGDFWGCIPADHFDEIGQLFGQSPGDGNPWLYLDFYRSVIARLRQEGF
ncbi:esterase/lipase family protein [Sorangium atrum]|uniref:Triacylglycerol lipase n=1 Tax=Sorangium atrum TaxID=2995308 RepID=A0ABT5BZM8_9BACT|nr:triacylglycerol lipase [Sorangium aterium]MDC0678412.1 triacylglycerol lipase [Sorangium aterium]